MGCLDLKRRQVEFGRQIDRDRPAARCVYAGLIHFLLTRDLRGISRTLHQHLPADHHHVAKSIAALIMGFEALVRYRSPPSIEHCLPMRIDLSVRLFGYPLIDHPWRSQMRGNFKWVEINDLASRHYYPSLNERS